MQKGERWVPLLLGLSVLVLFGPVIDYDFLYLDDNVNVFENPYLLFPTWENLAQFWRRPYEELYIPLTYTVWSLAAWIAGGEGELSPRAFHVFNLIFHLSSTLFVYGILQCLLQKKNPDGVKARMGPAAAMGALLFAFHPLQVESVVWVTGMKDTLSGVLSLASIFYFIQGFDKRGESEGKKFFVLPAFLFFMAAMLAKPSAVAVPLSLGILSLVFLGRSLKEVGKALLPWLAVVLPVIVITKSEQPDKIITYVAPLWAKLSIAGDALLFYGYKVLCPFWLAPDYGRNPHWVIESGWHYITWLVPLLLSAVAWKLRGQKVVLAAIGLFVAGVLPTLGFVSFQFQNLSTVADRYVYVAMLGPALALAFLVHSRGGKRTISVVMGVLAFLFILSSMQKGHWKDSATIARHMLSVNESSAGARNVLAVTLVQEGRYEEALPLYKEALEIRPSYGNVYNNMGVALFELGRYEEALSHYEKALIYSRHKGDAHNNLGNTLVKLGRGEEAFHHYGKALDADPANAGAHNNMGVAYDEKGEKERALFHYSRAISINPAFAEAHNNMGVILTERQDWDRALVHFNQALKFKPDYKNARVNLQAALSMRGAGDVPVPGDKPSLTTGEKVPSEVEKRPPEFVRAKAMNDQALALIQAGQVEEGVEKLLEAVRLRPDYGEAYNNLGLAMGRQGRVSEAVEYYVKSLEISPDKPETHYNLGNVFARQRMYRQAANSFEKALQIDPGFYEARRNLKKVRELQGKPSDHSPY